MGPPAMEPTETASTAPAASGEPATESAWERGLRHAKEVSPISRFEMQLSVFQIILT